MRFIGVLLAIFVMLPSLSQAHEVRPAIGDITLSDRNVSLVLTVNAEALLANIDLDGLLDTNEAEQAPDYDALRALMDGDILSKIQSDFANLPKITVSGQSGSVEMTLADAKIVPQPDPSLPRDSVLTMTAEVENTSEITLTWPKGFGALILRQTGEGGYTGYLDGGQTSDAIYKTAVGTSGVSLFLQYVVIGFEHILPKGADHILFVLGLFFLSTRARDLLVQVSLFTVAHTVTLGLGAAGIVNISPAIVEPLIALSISIVAIENVFLSRVSAWRPWVIFSFGLIHGLGFAGVLGEIGLPQGQFFVSLIAFNIGVELGQLTIVAACLLAFGIWFGGRPWYRARISIPASVAIAAVGLWWFVERTLL